MVVRIGFLTHTTAVCVCVCVCGGNVTYTLCKECM